MNKNILSKLQIFFYFVLVLFSYYFFYFLTKGEIISLYKEDNRYDIEDAFSLWKNLTSEQRLISSDTYYNSYINFINLIKNVTKSKINSNIDILIDIQIQDYKNSTYYYSNIHNVIISIIPKNIPKEKNYLLIASHFDGHNLTEGGTAYDDTIHIASIYGAIKALAMNDIKIKQRIDFLIDGCEEFELVGAYNFINLLKEKNISYTYDYLNLESMGSSSPYMFVIKNLEGSYRIQKALSKTYGTIMLCYNYIFDLGVIGSGTDHEAFNLMGWKGVVNVFLGEASHYHSIYDKIIPIKSKEHLKIAGYQLFQFILNYENKGYNENGVAYGISPFIIILPSYLIYTFGVILFITVYYLLFNKLKGQFKDIIKDIYKFFIILISVFCAFVLQGIIIGIFNTCSYCANQIFVIFIEFSGLCYFLIGNKIMKIKDWALCRLILNSILMIFLIKTDLSICLLILTFFSLLFYFIKNSKIRWIILLIQIFALSFNFSLSISIFMQFTPRLKGIIADISMNFFYFIFAIHVSVPGLSLISDQFIYKNEIKNNLQQIKKKENEEKKNNKIINESLLSSNKAKNYQSKIYLFYFVYPIVLIFILIFKDYPFSKNYTNIGEFLNIYEGTKENNSSELLFFYSKGKNYIEKNIKNLNIIFKKNYRKVYNGNAFSLSLKNKSINNNCEIPNFDINIKKIYSNNQSKNNFYIEFNNVPRCINAIYLYIGCYNNIIDLDEKTDCIIKGNNISLTKPQSFLQYRIGRKNLNEPLSKDTKIGGYFTLKTSSFNYTVLYNTININKEFHDFIYSFGEGSIYMRKCLKAFLDTVFYMNSTYKSN